MNESGIRKKVVILLHEMARATWPGARPEEDHDVLA